MTGAPHRRSPAIVPTALALALLALLAPPARAAASCTGTLPSGSHAVPLVVGSTHRSALVHIPAALTAGDRVPLVLALHGWGGSGPRMESYSGFSPIADRNRFIVAYPSSLGSHWNFTAARRGPDDVAFISALIGYLERNTCVNSRRVFAAGVSNGGGMVALAGCELAGLIAAIAPVAGDYTGQPACRPVRPLSVLEIHGTADQVVPYFGRGNVPTADGAPPFVNSWAARDGCSSTPTRSRIATRTTLYAWRWCVSGVRVQHIRIRNGRHQWPGATPPDPGPPATICASCTIWSFFSALSSAREWSASGGAGLPG